MTSIRRTCTTWSGIAAVADTTDLPATLLDLIEKTADLLAGSPITPARTRTAADLRAVADRLAGADVLAPDMALHRAVDVPVDRPHADAVAALAALADQVRAALADRAPRPRRWWCPWRIPLDGYDVVAIDRAGVPYRMYVDAVRPARSGRGDSLVVDLSGRAAALGAAAGRTGDPASGRAYAAMLDMARTAHQQAPRRLLAPPVTHPRGSDR
ncbi:hypothetical protein AB0G95_21785 [Streptomyces virginiae]|uniref:hypothetical protein n=1 Tax=Streptomyces virginiae TaxID=1961 RepID=UPI003422AF08